MLSSLPDPSLKPLQYTHEDSICKIPPSRAASPASWQRSTLPASDLSSAPCPALSLGQACPGHWTRVSFKSVLQGHQATAGHSGSQQGFARRTSHFNTHYHLPKHDRFVCFVVIVLKTALFLDSTTE